MPVPIQAGPVCTRPTSRIFAKAPAAQAFANAQPVVMVEIAVNQHCRAGLQKASASIRVSGTSSAGCSGRDLSLSGGRSQKVGSQCLAPHPDRPCTAMPNGVVTHDWVNFDGTHQRLGYSRQVRALPRLGTSGRQRPIPDRRIQLQAVDR